MNVARSLLLSVLFLVFATGAYTLSHRYFRSEEVTQAEGRLSLYRSTVVAELNRFSHLTFVLSRDPFVIETAGGAPTAPLNTRLASFADQAGLDAIYLMGLDGVTIAASNAGSPSSFVGQNYSFRPYFQDALAGRQGRFYGIGATTGLPGYFIADAVVSDLGEALGVIAIKIDLTELESRWREGGEQVLLTNADGVVLLASNPDWRYRALAPLGADQRAAIDEARQFQGQPLDPLDWRSEGDGRAFIGGLEVIHLSTSDLPHGWQLHYFASEDPARTRSWLATVIAVVIGGGVVLLMLLRRNALTQAALRRLEVEEAELRDAYDRLAVEIEDRRTAERRLERTQEDLARASRLAALGELAASVTHELGQPITAMRNHLAAAEMGGGARVISSLTGLVERMEGITRQLKFFSNPGEDDLKPVDLRDALAEALNLVAPNIETGRVILHRHVPVVPVIVQGNALRIEQVLVNLLRNAIDAMEDSEDRALHVSLGAEGGTAWVEVADRGHGLGNASLSELQEPFVTSRESGHGMGLGLAISAGIVKEHHGRMSARNREGGGAVFRVDIPLAASREETVE
ncbi:sensor histidine kinase [Nioella nitratireducens]|uniref:sensor histidine kinase n=1 Tax=Nioella nitratireducens TaxID=1287720 RepID=UPI0008FD5E0B|nr:ATP-binding protein [Nioella nitratireducens]